MAVDYAFLTSGCNAALILEMPMSLMWAAQEARDLFHCNLSSSKIVIHYLGSSICHTKEHRYQKIMCHAVKLLALPPATLFLLMLHRPKSELNDCCYAAN